MQVRKALLLAKVRGLDEVLEGENLWKQAHAPVCASVRQCWLYLVCTCATAPCRHVEASVHKLMLLV